MISRMSVPLILLVLFVVPVAGQDIEALLSGSNATQGFTVLNSNASSLFTVRGDGAVGVQTATPTASLHVGGTNGFLVTGTNNVGTLPASGPGIRMMFFPKKSAFRAGSIGGSHWDESNIGDMSVAFGQSTVASGLTSFAAGAFTTASGAGAVALGSQSTASGTRAFAMGNTATASGLHSIAMGFTTTASGLGSAAIGYSTTASGDYSTALGNGTTASGDRSTAMGGINVAAGSYSTAMGNFTQANGGASTAMGASTIASGASATAMGNSTIASGNNATAMGFATTASGGSSTAMGARVAATADGSFAIGDNSSTSSNVSISTPNRFAARFANGYHLFTTSSGESGVGAKLNASANSWSTISDSTKKTNFLAADGEDMLRRFRGLRLGSWNYRSQDVALRHYGAMAQEWFAAFGHDGIGAIGDDTTLSSADVDGVLSIAVQALERRTTELRATEAELSELRAELAVLRKDKETELSELRQQLADMRAEMQTLQNAFAAQRTPSPPPSPGFVQANDREPDR